jgi:hypothetical protein
LSACDESGHVVPNSAQTLGASSGERVVRA